jgi:dihydroorotase-like cyclic amidohydrolase
MTRFISGGLTYKGDIESESRAAAGGISFIEQPNTNAVTQEILEEKCTWLRDRMRIIRL